MNRLTEEWLERLPESIHYLVLERIAEIDAARTETSLSEMIAKTVQRLPGEQVSEFVDLYYLSHLVWELEQLVERSTKEDL